MEEQRMSTVTLGVSSLDEIGRELQGASRGEQGGAHISFASVDLLWEVLTPKRWELLQAMTGRGLTTACDLAPVVNREVAAIEHDVHALLLAGILDRDESGTVVFPYDAIHVDFTLTKAA